MEQLPLEVIGEILSRVEVARHVVRASLTCHKWREAYCKHLHTLSFDVADDERVYCRLPTSSLEILITKTIFQTSGLRKLSIRMHDNHKFSAGAAFGWLMFTRETLLGLFFMVCTSPGIDVLDVCGRKKLKTLCLGKCTIRNVEPVLQRFPCLTSLSLNRVTISVEDLNRLLLALPKLECLELRKPELHAEDEVHIERFLKLHFPTLKTLLIIDLSELGLILEKCDIGYLLVKNCTFGLFKVTGSKNLTHFEIYGSEFRLLEIEEADDLESLEIIHCRVSQSNLFPMNVQAPKLKRFQIWGFMEQMECFKRENEIILHESGLVVDLERIAVCSPQLSHLSLFFEKGVVDVEYKFSGLSSLENVVILHIGCDYYTRDYFHGFTEWAENLLKCCPNVRKLIVHGMVPEEKDHGFLEDLSEQTSMMFEMMRKYPHIEVKFTYMYRTLFRIY
ncbi:unnamed protein product [Cuscuta campestris]|uniref:F-box domain-containing protein n=1 Tax=Cuscuta campestris TaxID=132261 RepID=A0A484LEG9_9ASTE|nr:unnamed protein product [Cuscuta campestris]